MRAPFAFLGLAVAAATIASAGEPYKPSIDPANFTATIDNPYYPLVPGTTWKLVERAGKRITEENTIEVTRDTRDVMGVHCVVVHDVVLIKGKLREETYEWFAQDKQGNVWYFGEDTREFGPHGGVSTEGSWEAGVKGGQPGIAMPGDPKPGPPYRQEYGPGAAEDMGQVIALSDTVVAPAGTYETCVRTKEWSLLESGSERKWYAKGVGYVKGESPHHEVARLVEFTKP